MSKARAKKIKLILFDVDGVLTDGKIWIFPAPQGTEQSVLQQASKHGGTGGFGLHSTSLIEAKGFHAHDGVAMSLARLGGLKLGVITKRISETVALRARDLRLDYVYQGQNNKLEALEKIVSAEKVHEKNVSYMGDDIMDLPVLRRCGLAAPAGNAA